MVCFRHADATAGEANALAEMARDESRASLTVVTNQHHAFLTRFIFDRCLGEQVDVNVVYAHRDYGFWDCLARGVQKRGVLQSPL